MPSYIVLVSIFVCGIAVGGLAVIGTKFAALGALYARERTSRLALSEVKVMLLEDHSIEDVLSYIDKITGDEYS